jgi:hypothetical protein
VRYCTLFKDGDGHAAEFVACDAVEDGHRYGLSADGTHWHVEGVHLPDDRIVAFGAARGSMTDLYPELTPCGHPEGVPGAA